MSEQWTPPPAGTGTPTKVPNNLVLAIIATIVSFFACCIPHGLVSLIFALQVDKKATAGDIAGAEHAAKQAKTWGWVSIIVAIVVGVISFIFGAFSAILSVISNRAR
jgi:hypothetical protein